MLFSTLRTLSATCAFNAFRCVSLFIFAYPPHICSREYAMTLPPRRIYVKAYVVLECRFMKRKSKTFDKESFFKALADRTRLRLLNLLRTDEVCVCFFVE